MQKPGLFNRLRSYIWKEDEPTKPRVQIGLDVVEEMPQQAVTTTGNTSTTNFTATSVERPNDELRSFFEANGERELSKVEVLGVLNLISQAVVRDESVLDLSTMSQSANNSSAFPPSISNSFSTSNIGDLTSGSRSRRNRRPLASGPKRHSSKASISHSQSSHGIAIRKPAAPIETRSKRSLVPSRSMREFPREQISQTAVDVLDVLDSPMNDTAELPTTPGNGLRRRSVQPNTAAFTSTPAAKPSLRNPSVFTPSTPAAATTRSTTTQVLDGLFDPITQSVEASMKPTKLEKTAFSFGQKAPEPSAFSTLDSNVSLSQQAAKPVLKQPPVATGPAHFKAAPAPASDASLKQTSKPFTFDPAPASRAPAPAPVPAPLDIDDVDMDFDFPAPTTAASAADLQQGEEYVKDFVF